MTGNTAPKLQQIEVLRAIQTQYCQNDKRWFAAIDAAIAALAPPSGEGVELDHVRQRIELAIEHGDAHGWATARNELAGVLGSSCFTTPQSAPVDGDWRKFYSVEVKSDPPFPYGVAVITDANGEQSVHVHDDNPVLWHLLNKLTTPPPASQEIAIPRNADEAEAMEKLGFAWLAEHAPDRLTDAGRSRASQERGGDITCYVGDMKTSAGMRYYVCIERNGNTITPHEFGERYKAEYEVACWDAFFNDKPKPSALDFKPPNSAHPSYCPHCGQRDDGVLACCERYMEPPSSAAESDGDPCIECGADPGEPCTPTCCAAEQAKPVAELVKDGPPYSEKEFSRIIDAHAEQAQSGELPPLPEAAGMAEFGRAFTADQMREYRLAGGVTVDDAAIHRAADAYATSLAERYGEGEGDIVAMRAAVEALGAK